MDQLERGLRDIREQALAVWKHHNCLECPMGELAALASALLAFYPLNSPSSSSSEPSHWSDAWKKSRGG